MWLPDLAPSAELLAYGKSGPLTSQRWTTFSRRYRAEMRQPAARRLLATLAALSSEANFSLGCYCLDESRCHRTILRELLIDAGAEVH